MMTKGLSVALNSTRALGVFCARVVSAAVALCGLALGAGAVWFIVDRVGLDTWTSNPVTVVVAAFFTLAYLAAVLMVLGIAIAGSVRAMSVDLRRGGRLVRRAVRRAVTTTPRNESAESDRPVSAL
jgi:cytochrome c oxidase assembly factor CtaG